MPNSIEDILHDLYQIDPSLQVHETKLRQVVQQLQAARPDMQANPLMVKELRARLETMTVPSAAGKRTWVWWLVPVAATAMVAIVALHPKKGPQVAVLYAGRSIVHTAAPEAFGAFRGATTTTQSTGLAAGAGNKDAVAVPSMILPGDYTMSVFTYTSALSFPSIPVLRRDGSVDAGDSWTSGGLFDRQRFAGLQVSSMTAAESTKDGFTISLDYQHGTASLYRQNDGLVKALAVQDETTSRPIPQDQAIKTAKQFLSDHGISIAQYDAPQVPSSLGPKGMVQSYYGNTGAMVIFPLSVTGYPVVDSSGLPFGLQVSIGSDGTVQSVSNILNLNFTASKYTLISSSKDVTDYLARGGWQWSSVPKDAKTTSYALEAPRQVYMYSSYQIANDQHEYLVPALLFGVKDADQATVGRANVVVPLLADLLQPMTTIDTMPSANGSGTSAGSSTVAVPPEGSVAPVPTKVP